MTNLKAPPEYWSLSPDEKDKLTNGCGPAGWKGNLIPDDLLGVSIKEPCNIHDFRYSNGGNESDRKVADREFLENMLEVVETESHDFFLKQARRRLALDYYCVVRDSGEEYFIFTH